MPPIAETVRGWAGDEAWQLGEINIGNASVEVAKDFAARAGRLVAAYVVDFAERGFTPEVIARSRDCKCAGHLATWLSSQDQARYVSAQGDGSARDARFLAFACAVLPGLWLIYQGEELGLPQPELSRDETGDPFDGSFCPGGPGREGARVPVLWPREARLTSSGTPNPGYPCTGGRACP